MTIIIGALLCVLGFATYAFAFQLGADKRSPTALIPAFVGAIFILLGYFSLLKPTLRKHLMHVAVALALLGALGTIPMGIRGLTKPPPSEGTPRKGIAAPISQLAMGSLLAVYVVLGVRSFIAARKAREAAQPG